MVSLPASFYLRYFESNFRKLRLSQYCHGETLECLGMTKVETDRGVRGGWPMIEERRTNVSCRIT